MSRDLERLIESLITDISCYGDLGCTVSHVLESLSIFYKDAQPEQDAAAELTQSKFAEPNQLLWSTAWDWLRARKDIAVGANRKWNHLALSDVLAIPDPDSHDGSADTETPRGVPEGALNIPQTSEQPQTTARKDVPRKRPRIYVAEDRMWEAIAGHAPDYRRVPRLEWMALVGIASTKQQGILQGDLGRLVGQDKRSLPKRTDALADKGYISKRTTLVRGTKTSKMWLTRFAPALPTNPLKATANLHTTVDMSRDALACDLEPVPWRNRWNADSVDYISLAQTIMAVVKAFGIIRYHDLRCKLGILGLRWQMKVAAKTCRFFVQTGAIQYVGATLSGKLFKDCLKFDHDLTHEDWAAYLATGKQKNVSFSSANLVNADLGAGLADTAAKADTSYSESGVRRNANKKHINSRSKWSPDKPLVTTVFDNISAAGAAGLSNKQIGDSTLGSSFRRYLSSISSTISLPTQQPKHLEHFQVTSEMHRKGKSQQYRYFARGSQRVPESIAPEDTVDEEISNKHSTTEVDNGDRFSGLFTDPNVLPDTARAAAGLAALAHVSGRGLNAISKRKAEFLDSPRSKESRGTAVRRAKRMKVAEQADDEALDDRGFSKRVSVEPEPGPSARMSTRRGTRGRLAETETTSLIITLKMDPSVLSNALGATDTKVEVCPVSEDIQDVSTMESKDATSAISEQPTNSSALSAKKTCLTDPSIEEITDPIDAPEVAESIVVASAVTSEDVNVDNTDVVDEDSAEGSPMKRGGRRKKKAAAKQSARGRSKVFKCDNCGGTWKNDVGIKYHLEKSKTTCNPSYLPPLSGPPEALFSTVKRPTPAKRAVAVPRQIKSRHSRSSAIAGSLVDDDQDADQAPENSILVVDPAISTGSSRGRNMGRSGSRQLNASSETRQGVRKRMASQRRCVNLSSVPKPPVSSVQASMSGLINDNAGVVRDMPAEHAPLQPTFKRSQAEDGPNVDEAHVTPEHCNQSLSGIYEPEQPSPSMLKKARVSFGRRDSSPGPAKPRLGRDSHSSRATESRNTHSPVFGASQMSHAEALRASLTDNGTLPEPDIMERALLYILRANGGVFPGGQSLWYAVIATWETSFASEEAPDHQRYKDALARLAKKKQIAVSTHAFKDSRGMMANYQLIRIPGVGATSPAGVAMKTNIIAEHPKVYTPPAFTPRAGFPEEHKYDAQPVFSSRRKLVQGIEVLDAPFYAIKAANERPATPPEGFQSPRKRRKRMVTKEQLTHAEDEGPDGKRRKDIFRIFTDGRADPSDGPSASSRDGTGGFTPRLVFLSPNAYLGQEVPEDVRHASLPNLPDPEPTYPATQVESIMTSNYNITFADADMIVGKNGAWPVHDNSFFETEDRSLTICGWMPDSRWFLRQNLPHSLAEMIKWRGRPKAKLPSSSQYYEFAEQVDACFDWELSTEGMKLLLAESIVPEHIFIHHGVGDLPREWEYPALEWDPANQLSPSALFDIQISEQATTATDHLWGGELGRQRRRKRRQNKLATEPKELVVGIDLKIRTLITLPRDVDLRDVSRRNAGLDETNETILIAAFVVTRTLLGGADRIIEWGLMMTLFPDMALSAMRRFWSKARKDRGTFINQLTERFQIQFIVAYENNEFPPIDFDDYVDYDWPRLIKWTAGLIEDSQELPANKAALERGYSLGSAWTDVTNWRDDYYNFQMSVFNRFEAATSRPATCLVDEDNESMTKPDAEDLVTAMSWLRSLCYTHRDRYAPQDIRKKMASIGGGNEDRIQSLLEQAVETLQGQGVITDSKLKALEGRPYRLTETFLPRFMKWTHEVKFIDAARFKSQLDVSFRQGEKIRIPYVLKDGEVMAMMNLQASGRVIVTTVDVPSIPLGFDPGNYESRKYPKSYYNFGLEIAPTGTYVYDDDLDILRQAKSDKPPRENHNRAIPLWSDFFGEMDIDRWSQVLGAVAFVIATRGPLDVASVCAVLKPYLQEFEVQMVFDWGRRNGVLKGMALGASCTVDEWWWLLIGRQRTCAG
ncbi:Tfiiic transcription initiation factor complex subunits tfc3 [Colletotrichum higginsianum IMI 349063]|uniref:Tfiiic transcription initiation factor complex subunits tfc3 n=5 Tax=Colletotrichum higginsianum TaxID=80884 RepID=A0A1B7YJC2_COLHI|nr:Tfiiic transcription initiation factor complex subunits tfc3 [Colletotrichum higginsianum IMI 349063]OBR12181.1 Tfiiic transcription initiation factor complex subunits tfc3 [Colletotrichum higginsianum IMI 349063]